MSALSPPVLMSVAVLASAAAAAAVLPRSRSLPPARGGPGPGDPDGERAEVPVLRLTATGAVALGAAVLVGGVVGMVAAALAGAVCWRVTGRMEPPAARRRREELVDAVPHVVDLMAACLSAGLSPDAAVEQIAEAVQPPVREELEALSSRLRLGVDPVTVWSDLARHPQLGGLGRSLARAVDSGASVAEAMQRLAEDLRRTARAEVETRARAVGVKAAVPLGICLLPAFVLVGVVPLVAGSVTVLVGR